MTLVADNRIYFSGVHGIYFNKELVQNTPMNKKIELSLIDRIESIMGHFEKALDYAGSVPGISSFSGAVRVGYGLIQLITASVMKCFTETALDFAKILNGDVEYWQKIDNRVVNHLMHGALNIGRGFVESIPFVNLALAKHVRERDILVYTHYDAHDALKDETFVNTNKKEDLREPPISHVTNNGTSIWYNRFYYEGELKRMHLNVQEEAKKHIILKDDTKIVLNSAV